MICWSENLNVIIHPLAAFMIMRGRRRSDEKPEAENSKVSWYFVADLTCHLTADFRQVETCHCQTSLREFPHVLPVLSRDEKHFPLSSLSCDALSLGKRTRKCFLHFSGRFSSQLSLRFTSARTRFFPITIRKHFSSSFYWIFIEFNYKVTSSS